MVPCTSSPQVCEDGPFQGYARLHWIEAAARARSGEVCHVSMPHLNPTNPRRAFQELDGSKAVGIDTSERSVAKHSPKSRMREMRTSGSVRSAGGQPPALT